MKHIIVPVDLSKNSKEALRYAVHIALKANAELTIVHCYSLLLKAVFHSTKNGLTEKDPEKWIQKRITKINLKHPELKVDFRIIKGDTMDSLRRVVEVTEADLVIMGAQGAGENEETFLGSISGGMIKTTDIPALIVPPRYRFTGIDRVVFAAKNPFVRDQKTLEPIIEIRNLFHPHIQLLHLGEDQPPSPDQTISILQVIDDVTRYGNDNFNESIHEYLSQYHADLLCVMRRKRGFLEKTLGPTRTPADKFHTDLPVLVLVGDDY
jgi:nucleotide-binding universal stress UspA family protein